MHHRSGRAHVDGDAQSQLLRPHLQGTQARRLLGEACRRDHPGRSARTLLVHLPMPLAQLLLQVLQVLEAADLKEGALHEPHQVFYRSLLLRPVRPTQLHSDAHFQRGAGEDRIPFAHLAVPPPLQRHGLGAVEHTHQRRSSPTVQMLRQAPHQTLHRLILHPRDAHPARVLQA